MTSQKNPSAPLTCAEFQEHLPELFSAESEGVTGDPALLDHLNTCENCAALVRDLQYIADQARQLLEPVHDPSDDVWDKIQKGLAVEPSLDLNKI